MKSDFLQKPEAYISHGILELWSPVFEQNRDLILIYPSPFFLLKMCYSLNRVSDYIKLFYPKIEYRNIGRFKFIQQ